MLIFYENKKAYLLQVKLNESIYERCDRLGACVFLKGCFPFYFF